MENSDKNSFRMWMPGMEMNPRTGMNSNMSMNPGMGMNPGMSMNPGMGMMPGMWMQPGMGRCPQPGIPPYYEPMPYSNMFSHTGAYPNVYLEEMETERDMQKLKEMYPEVAKDILVHVEDECDKMEYDGSLMFDAYPDRVMLMRIRDNIYDKVKDKYPVEEMDDRDEAMEMQQEGRRRYPPRKNWLGDLIDVLLFQEMHHRRCRRRNCGRRY